ncbi:MAG: tetratricopeptide repeat protein [Methylococcales bacterium]|nr:tetratricopeptide repeat protein [Methylococcales bacterium]
MSPERQLTAEEENQWQELSRHIEWAKRFSLIVLFVEDSLLAAVFLQRLQQHIQGRVSKLHIIKPSQPDNLAAFVFKELRLGQIPHALVPRWLELHQHRTPEWQRAIDNFFARFNERRDLIRRDYPCPFIILLPLAYKSRLREIAPDLWSVRTFTDELHPAPPSPPTPLPLPTLVAEPIVATLDVDALALKEPAIREWQRVKGLAMADREWFLVLVNAFAAAFEAGFYPLALGLALQLVGLADKLLREDSDDVINIENAGFALRRLGDIQQATGHYDEAYQAFKQSEQLGRAWLSCEPENAYALRALSVSLENVADIDRILGRYDAAVMGYQDSLQLFRELQTCLGATPEVLRGLSVSLEKVADMDALLGHFEVALTGYKESLQLCRELQVQLGDTPQVLRDLSVSLNKTADVEQRLGCYEAALTAYNESLQLRRLLQTRLGDTPQVLRDLSASLDRTADAEQHVGRYEAALTRYDESLQLRRVLQNRLGDTSQVLRDLSVSLNKTADVERHLGHYEAALLNYNESLQLFRELKARLGDTPEVLRDLTIALENLGDCETSLGHTSAALAAYQECLPLLERLQATQGYDQYSPRIADIKAKMAELTGRNKAV